MMGKGFRRWVIVSIARDEDPPHVAESHASYALDDQVAEDVLVDRVA
jgi:hypothetical protein